MTLPLPERAALQRSSPYRRLPSPGLAVALVAAAAWTAAAPVGSAAQAPGPDTVPRAPAGDPNFGLRPPLTGCPLGARLAIVREEGACVRARQTLLPSVPRVLTYLPLADGSLRATPMEMRGSWRSGYPADRNDGLLWSGRGLSASVTGGMEARWRRYALVLAPELARSANRSFLLPDTVSPGWSRYADPWNTPGLDRYLRPGEGPVTWLGWGDSYMEAGVGPARLGLSTERLWWGPARRYPLLFSGSGPGFPHVYAESDGEIALLSGGVRVRALGGHLDESDWFDADEGNDRRLLAAAQLAWRLGFVPGAEVALSVVRHEPLPDGGTGVLRWTQIATGDPEGEPHQRRGSGMSTLSFRLSFPGEGIEAYGEVGHGVFFTNAIPGVSDASHAQVYTLGMTRSDISPGGVHWRFWGELTRQSLETPQPAASRAAVTLRAPSLPHGHTHRGQLLGSWIGPGSNAQIVGLDFPGDAGSLGFFAERVRRDDDTYVRVHYADHGFRAYDLEWTLGARGARSLSLGPGGTLQLHAEGGISRRKNRSFVGLDWGRNWTWVREWNRWLDLRLLWTPE
ncbi:MAG TPA: hypothetical protein VLH75_18985 [Longimicrobiales bacterium]|nr:hypothetical protein [Longimicrobiales bacterium]